MTRNRFFRQVFIATLLFVCANAHAQEAGPFSIDSANQFENSQSATQPSSEKIANQEQGATKNLTEPQSLDKIKVPKLTSPVVDLVSLLTPEEAARLEKKIIAIRKAQGPQIQILVIPSLSGNGIEDYSIRVAEAWKIGRKEQGDGIIILMAQQEREVRIEVGDGIEGEITDLIAHQIIQQKLIPNFKRGKFFQGFNTAIDELILPFNISPRQNGIFSDKDINDLKNIARVREEKKKLLQFALPLLIFFLSFPLLKRIFRRREFLTAVSSSIYLGALNFAINGKLSLAVLGAILGFVIGIIGPLNFFLAILSMAGRSGRGSSGGSGWSGGGGGFSGGGASGRW